MNLIIQSGEAIQLRGGDIVYGLDDEIHGITWINSILGASSTGKSAHFSSIHRLGSAGNEIYFSGPGLSSGIKPGRRLKLTVRKVCTKSCI